MLIQFKHVILSLLASFNFNGQPVNVGEVSCLSQAVFFEAKSESYEGKLAVANVIRNRTENDLFPKSVCAVIAQKGQFSFFKKSNKVKIDVQNESVYKQVVDSINVAVAVLSGQERDNTHGAIAFINPRLATNKSWLHHFHKTVSIGGHSFYALREHGETSYN